MPFRTVGAQSIVVAGTAQPVFATAITAQSNMNSSIGFQISMSTITVASTALFRKGDMVSAGAGVGITDSGGVVYKIISGTQIMVQGFNLVHTTGEYLYLSTQYNKVWIQVMIGNTGNLFIGTAPTVSITDPSLIYVLQPPAATTGGPLPEFMPNRTMENAAIQPSEYWINGTVTGDKFIAALEGF